MPFNNYSLLGLERTAEFDVMEQLVCFLCKLCRMFGRTYTYKKVGFLTRYMKQTLKKLKEAIEKREKLNRMVF